MAGSSLNNCLKNICNNAKNIFFFDIFNNFQEIRAYNSFRIHKFAPEIKVFERL